MRHIYQPITVSKRGSGMDLTKALCLVLALTALAACSRGVQHPDAAPGSYYYQKEQTARDMKQERDQREYNDYQKSQ
jgi:hypothetical protein